MRFTQITRLNGEDGMRILADREELEKLRDQIAEALASPKSQASAECERGFVLVVVEDE